MKRLAFILLICLSASLYAQTPAIVVDSSLSVPMTEIIRAYEADTGQAVQLAYGSSDKIARQIVQGVPYELFVSVSVHNIDLLFRRGVISTSGWEFARGQIAIFVSEHSSLHPVTDLQSLMTALRFQNYHKIAIADPESLAYGVAALQALQSAGIWAFEQGRTLLAEDVARLEEFALSDVVDLAFIPYSFTRLETLKGKGNHILVPQEWYEPVTYYVVLQTNASTATREFERFLAGDKVRGILEQYGYLTPEVQ